MLRSIDELRGYTLMAQDGEIGRCKDFLLEDSSWVVRYMVADTNKWLPGRKVLVSTHVSRSARLERADVSDRLDQGAARRQPPAGSGRASVAQVRGDVAALLGRQPALGPRARALSGLPSGADRRDYAGRPARGRDSGAGRRVAVRAGSQKLSNTKVRVRQEVPKSKILQNRKSSPRFVFGRSA